MKLNTIKNNRDFIKVYKNGRSYVGAYVVLYAFKNEYNTKRIGITASKKVGNAVVRNRVRRLIRNSIVKEFEKFQDGYDYVFVARVKSAGISQEKMQKNIHYLAVISSKKSKKNTKYSNSEK
ncbi:MAG: ribonuclease P protein component [Clostridiales bacterium]|nr:MAG: ribonuclease P protein component [Clostridiales bacterium]